MSWIPLFAQNQRDAHSRAMRQIDEMYTGGSGSGYIPRPHIADADLNCDIAKRDSNNWWSITPNWNDNLIDVAFTRWGAKRRARRMVREELERRAEEAKSPRSLGGS